MTMRQTSHTHVDPRRNGAKRPMFATRWVATTASCNKFNEIEGPTPHQEQIPHSITPCTTFISSARLAHASPVEALSGPARGPGLQLAAFWPSR